MMLEVSVWLVPQPEDYAHLQGVIAQLASQYDAPPFRPHLTVAGRLSAAPHFQNTFTEVAATTPVLTLANQGLDHSPEFFRTVFIRTSLDPALLALRQKIDALWPNNLIKPLMPHISLIYKTLDSAQRQAIIQSLRVQDTFIFNTLAVVRPQLEGNWLAVDTWQILAQWPLATDIL
jgi:2'-5' RNA ligase